MALQPVPTVRRPGGRIQLVVLHAGRRVALQSGRVLRRSGTTIVASDDLSGFSRGSFDSVIRSLSSEEITFVRSF